MPAPTLRNETPNQFLRNTATRRAFYVEQYKNWLVKKYVGQLNTQVYPEIEFRIDQAMHALRARRLWEPGNHDALRRMFAQVDRIVADAFEEAERKLTIDMKSLAKDEREHERSMLLAAFPAATVAVPRMTKVTKAVLDRPFHGRTLKEWMRNLTRSQQQDLRQQLQMGITRGENEREIVRRVRGTSGAQFEDGSFGSGRRHLQSVVLGAATHTAAQSRQVMRDLNILLVPRVQWTCVLDAATCLECMSYHGMIFKVEEGPRPPLHVRCRCIALPIGPGEAAEKQTFDEWLHEQPEEVIVEALGTRRARHFRAGSFKVGDFTNSVGRTYTLKELRAKEPWAFRAARID